MARSRWWILVLALLALLFLARFPGEEPAPDGGTPGGTPVASPRGAAVSPEGPEPAPPPPESPAAPAPPPAPDPGKGTLVGTALRLDGEPAAGAKVRAAPGGDEAKRVVATADAEGAFRIEGLAPGRWTVACAGGGYGTRLDGRAEAAVAEVVAGAEVRVEVRAQALAVVAGRVTGPDGRPVADAKVVVLCAAFLSPEGGVWRLETATGPDGSYEVRNVSPGENAALSVSADGFGGDFRYLPAVASGSRVTVDVALKPGVSLDLLLVAADDGSPVREAYVWIHDAEGGHLYDGGHGDAFVPDGKGIVHASGLGPGPLNVQVDAKGFVAVRDTRVDPATLTGPFTFRLVRASGISGRVLRADGSPAAGQTVRAVPEGAGSPHEFLEGPIAETADDGTFRIEGLPPGRVAVGVYGPSLQPLSSTVVEGGATWVVLTLPEGAGSRRVRVRFADPDGKPVPRARVRTGQMQEGWMVRRSGGGFPEAEATVDLEADLASFVEAWDAVDEGGNRLPLGHVLVVVPPDAPEEWVVRLPPERAIEGTVVGPGGQPVEGASVEVVTVPGEEFGPSMAGELRGVLAGKGGAFRVDGLGRERVRLTASAEGLVGSPVEAEAGSGGVVLTLAGEARCELRVLDDGGRPVEGASVVAWVPGADDEGPGPVGRSGTTDSQGRVRLRGLRPGVACELLVQVHPRSRGLLDLRRAPWLPESGDLRLERGWGIEGVVRLEEGAAPEEWRGTVSAWRGEECAGTARIGPDGRFALGSLPAGRYELRAAVEDAGRSLAGAVAAETGAGAVVLVVKER